MSTGRLSDWAPFAPFPLVKGTPAERDAAVRCLARVSLRVADGAAGLRVVLQALGLDDEPEAVK